MLEELIVLGQIPGTHLQVSYAGFVILLFVLLLVVDSRHYIPRVNIKKIIPRKLAHA